MRLLAGLLTMAGAAAAYHRLALRGSALAGCVFGLLFQNCLGQVRQIDRRIITPSGFELTIPKRWVKSPSLRGNVICSVPLDRCQTGTGGVPNPGAAQIGVSEFSGNQDSANGEASKIMARERIRKSDRNRLIDTRVAAKTSMRTIGWEERSPSVDPGPSLVIKLHYVFVKSAIVKVFLEYWKNDPASVRYERECEEMVRSLAGGR